MSNVSFYKHNLDLRLNFVSIIELEKKIKKAVIVCFVTKEKILHLDDRIGVNMIFSEPAQMLQADNKQVHNKLHQN
jgi:hypothetical protein